MIPLGYAFYIAYYKARSISVVNTIFFIYKLTLQEDKIREFIELKIRS